MRGPGLAVWFLAVLAGALVLAAACGGGDEELRESRIVTPESEGSPGGPPTEADPDDEDTPEPSPTPGEEEPTEAPTTPTPEPEDDENDENDEDPPSSNLDAVMAAASEALGIPAGDDCSEDDDCIQPLPGGASDPSGDISRLAYGSASGGGAILVMARDSAGAWGVWMLTQSGYQLFDLPGELLACARPAIVRESPSSGAAAIGEVAREEALSATGLELTAPGSLSGRGSAWYSVSAPIGGWVAAEDVTAATNGDCSHRDEAEGEPNPRG